MSKRKITRADAAVQPTGTGWHLSLGRTGLHLTAGRHPTLSLSLPTLAWGASVSVSVSGLITTAGRWTQLLP
ncbi:hypothetical protein KUF83_19615 [Streptomyces sp. BV286]|uniref:hypothetical protein n=1 Tax=Streptomyces sp. BV286 TaxID=2849672 RepID=UPI001C2F06EE|nr:hypothetical protein [Streptomyces sp. BV286]MBV1938752.1 hypothetical protein [Streptomyces sp. BV286]